MDHQGQAFVKDRILNVIDGAGGQFLVAKEIADKTGKKITDIAPVLTVLTEDEQVLERQKVPHPTLKRTVFGYRRRESGAPAEGKARVLRRKAGPTGTNAAAKTRRVRATAPVGRTARGAKPRATAIAPSLGERALEVTIAFQVASRQITLTLPEAQQLYQSLGALFSSAQK